uniref:Putative transposase-like protein n=1 Tax=Panstrongylus lignarius TaxID=156445 RepID=A0A224XVK7_9HEMI
MTVGLIANERKCNVCGERMKLVSKKCLSDGYIWMCRSRASDSKHVSSISVRKNSWFECSKLSMIDILLLTYYWYHRCQNKFIIEDMNVSSRTVVDWKSFCREVCMDICVKESCAIGGVDVIVEIDESKFGKRKYNRGRMVNGRWVFGGIERGSNRTFFSVVENRGKDVLLSIIKTFILPGTTIISDCWKSYDCLEDEGYKHLKVNHSLQFIHPETGAHTNTIEGTWSAIKRQLPTNYCQGQFDSYLAEYMWRRKTTTFNNFLTAITAIYPISEEC